MITERATDAAIGICPACGERNPSHARYCMSCGARMAVDSGERTTVTVLFADLSGFTAFSETVDPEAVRAVASEAASRFGEIVVRHGGVVDKVIGDCVMATFGTEGARSDDAQRAVRAAIAMQDEIAVNAARFAGLHLSIGVMTGEVLRAAVGRSGEVTVLGEPVNEAARLQSAAERGEILIGAPTRTAVEGAIDVEEVAGTDDAWRVLGIAGSHRRRPRAPLVGRGFELDRIAELWERATAEQRPYVLTMLGPPGIGKRRLVEAFAARVGSGAQVVKGACLPYGDGFTYWPVTEWLRAAAGLAHDDPTEAVSQKLGALLESLGVEELDQLRTMAVAIAHLVAAPTTPRGTFDATNLSRGELHWGIRRVFEALSLQRPLVLVLHDAHAAEPALLDLVTSLAGGERDARLLVIVAARETILERPTRLVAPGGRRRLMTVGPLAGEAGSAMREALGGSDVAARDEPLFIEEAALLRRGAPDADVPSELRALIEQRLRLLDPAARATLARAACMGEIFWERALASAVGDDRARAGIEAGIEHAFIRRMPTSSVAGEREYAFEHPLFVEVARALVPDDERRVLHRDFADWIRALPGADEAYPELLAYHLREACAAGAEEQTAIAAVEALEAAARRADAHEGTEEAMRFRAHALDLLAGRDPVRALHLSFSLACARAARGDRSAAAELKRVATDAAAPDELACSAATVLSGLVRDAGDVAGARALLDDARSRAADERQSIGVLLASASLAARFEDDKDAADRDVETAVALATRIDDPDLAIEAEALAGDVAFHRLQLARAREHLERALALARTRGSIRWEAITGAALATVLDHRGPTIDAILHAERTLELLERAPDPALRVQTLRLLGIISLSRGDGAAAERRLQAAAADARALGPRTAVDIDRFLTAALCWMGRARAASRTASRARAAADPSHGPSVAAAALAEAYVAATTGDEPLARARFDEAVASIEAHGFALDIADVHLLRGRTLVFLGDPTGARSALERAREIYARAGADARLTEVDEASLVLA
jgi:class 3 adenylate cyclase/tetratricopeptide (TPR) repeat protein